LLHLVTFPDTLLGGANYNQIVTNHYGRLNANSSSSTTLHCVFYGRHG
jgi:hypothetical protein